jgi:phage terminase small subunit
MPVLDNPRQELFAQQLSAGKTASEALKLAGYAANSHNSSRMKKNEKVMKRIEELQSRNLQIQDKAVEIAAAPIAEHVSPIRIAAQLAKAYAVAEKQERPADMVAATIAMAKFSGQWVERSEVAQTNEFAGLSPEEMRRELVQRARRLGLDREIAGLLEAPDRWG